MNGSWKINCRQAHELLSERMDRELGAGEVLRLRAHLLICEMCTRVSRQMDFMRQAIRRLGE